MQCLGRACEGGMVPEHLGPYSCGKHVRARGVRSVAATTRRRARRPTQHAALALPLLLQLRNALIHGPLRHEAAECGHRRLADFQAARLHCFLSLHNSHGRQLMQHLACRTGNHCNRCQLAHHGASTRGACEMVVQAFQTSRPQCRCGSASAKQHQNYSAIKGTGREHEGGAQLG